jgi:hypothetical protein
MRARGSRVLIIGLLLLGITAFASADEHPREQWGPFAGRIVDAETGQPIPGAAVLVVWREAAGFALLETRFYEAKETTTDATGRWEIPRMETSRMRVTVKPPAVYSFVPGYLVHTRIVTPTTGRPYLDETVTTMKRLNTRRELIAKSRSRPSDIPLDKMPVFTEAINRERQMLGFDLLPIPSSP